MCIEGYLFSLFCYLWNIMKCPESPAPLQGLEDLKVDLDGQLLDSIVTGTMTNYRYGVQTYTNIIQNISLFPHPYPQAHNRSVTPAAWVASAGLLELL